MHGWELAIVAVVVAAYASVSRAVGRTPITAAIVFVSCGLLVGGHGLGWFSVHSNAESVRVLAEATLTLVLFTDASRIDIAALRREYAVPARLLGIGLPLTILAGWALALVLFGGFDPAEALVLAIILAPTDAALGQAVVTDARLPSRIRQGLNVESGLNDGICVPLLYIALALAESESHVAGGHAAVTLVARAIGYGVLFGVLAGAGGALLLRAGETRRLASPVWVPVLPLGAAAASYGLAAPLGGSGFIAAFVAGFVFGLLRRGRADVTQLVEEIGGVANAATLVVFGAAIVGPVLSDMSVEAAVYAVLSLTVVRMLPVAISLIGTRPRPQTVAFVGWFGPRGLASIVFTVVVLDQSDLPHVTPITVAVVFTVLLSVYAHGLTSRPLTDRYARWFGSHPEDRRPRMESVPAAHQRWRRALDPGH